MALEDYCASCTYMGETADRDGKYNCEKRYRVYATDPKCGSYCQAYNRTTSARENMYNNSRSHNTSSGCYLTTIMSSVLGYTDDNRYLNTLRSFRDNYMKNDELGQELLLLYDTIGPKIAKAIENDMRNYVIATYYFRNYIKKAVEEIKASNYTEAMKTYATMTKNLISLYQLEKEPININIKNIDKKYLGHGKVRTLKKENESL